MADDADRAQLEIESELTYARLAAQVRFRLIPSGHCHSARSKLSARDNYFAIASVH